ncbi:MAG TPA: DUF924 family protein [Caulobacteraceae bacterium]|jgi:uncharacterized protein (DUF924 family)
MSTIPSAEVVAYWLAAGPRKWFAKDEAFDADIRARFEALHFAAARRELDAWAATGESLLGLLLLVDQFPRNMYRGSAHAFATDPLARMFARQALERGFDRAADKAVRPFFYLPFEHSEFLADQDFGCERVAQWVDEGGDADTLKWANIHRDIIKRFGRFPHRNAAFGRESTPEELAFLADGGFSG